MHRMPGSRALKASTGACMGRGTRQRAAVWLSRRPSPSCAFVRRPRSEPPTRAMKAGARTYSLLLDLPGRGAAVVCRQRVPSWRALHSARHAAAAARSAAANSAVPPPPPQSAWAAAAAKAESRSRPLPRSTHTSWLTGTPAHDIIVTLGPGTRCNFSRTNSPHLRLSAPIQRTAFRCFSPCLLPALGRLPNKLMVLPCHGSPPTGTRFRVFWCFLISPGVTGVTNAALPGSVEGQPDRV